MAFWQTGDFEEQVMSRNVWSVCLVLAFASFGAFAAADAPVVERAGTTAHSQFDSRIDSWVEGNVMALDADSGKFTVRAYKLPYASAFAEMLKDMHAKVKDLPEAERKAKMEDVRKAWADRLAKAKAERAAENPSDFTFAVSDKNALKVMSSKQVRADYLSLNSGAKAEEPIATSVEKKDTAPEFKGGDAKEQAAMMAFKDLKVGDRVLVGYDAGMVTNDAYAVVKRDADEKK
jgi:hypothetical protein